MYHISAQSLANVTVAPINIDLLGLYQLDTRPQALTRVSGYFLAVTLNTRDDVKLTGMVR